MAYYIMLMRPGNSTPDIETYENRELAVQRLSDLCNQAKTDRLVATYKVYIFVGERAVIAGYPGRELVGPGEERTPLLIPTIESEQDDNISLIPPSARPIH